MKLDMPEGIGQEQILLAFDYGDTRIGVALGNTVTRCARALTVLSRRTAVADGYSQLAHMIQLWQPSQIIVGLPVYPDARVHPVAQRAQRFGEQLRLRFGLSVIWINEAYSSVAARALPGFKLKRGEPIDALAACVILQQFFDTPHDRLHE
jgi:putative holliday junction resolvase